MALLPVHLNENWTNANDGTKPKHRNTHMHACIHLFCPTSPSRVCSVWPLLNLQMTKARQTTHEYPPPPLTTPPLTPPPLTPHPHPDPFPHTPRQHFSSYYVGGKRGGTSSPKRKESAASPRRKEALKRFVSMVKRRGSGTKRAKGPYAAGFRLLHVDIFQVSRGATSVSSLLRLLHLFFSCFFLFCKVHDV